MKNLSILVATSNRAEMAKTFGSWVSKSATPSDLVSWADKRTEMYLGWIENLKELKNENQLKLVDGLSIEQLQNVLEAKRQEN